MLFLDTRPGKGRLVPRFPKSLLEEQSKLGQSQVGVVPISMNRKSGARLSRQQQKAEHALAVYPLAALLDKDVTCKLAGGLDEGRRRSGMETELVENLEVSR